MLEVPVAPKEPVLAMYDQIGVPYEDWDAATLAARVPGIDTGRYWPPKRLDDEAFWAEPTGKLGAFFNPDGGFIDDAQLAAVNLVDAARRRASRSCSGTRSRASADRRAQWRTGGRAGPGRRGQRADTAR